MNTDKIKIQDAYYKLNSDNKIELHLKDKETYKNLPVEAQKDIKRGFIWGRQRGAWVSRSKGGHIPYSMKKYDIPYQGADQIKSFEEAEEQKANRLSAKADRFKNYAQNAQKRAENLQADFNRLRKDWSWLTQPNINSSAGRAFTNSRNKVMNRYERGFEEYRKAGNLSEYAKQLEISASQTELRDLGYLNNRLKENKKVLNKFKKFEEYYTEIMKDDNLSDETLMYLDGQMNFYKRAFDKYEYYKHFYDTLIEEKKESGNFFDEAAAKKTIKKDFKEFLKKHFDIKLLKMSIAYTAKSGTAYYYKTDKPLPKMFHSGWAAEDTAQKKVQELYLLMDNYLNSLAVKENTEQKEIKQRVLFG